MLSFRAGDDAKFESCKAEVRSPNPWSLWRAITRDLPRDSSHLLGPGWIGFIGYEMARTLERNRSPLVGDPPLPWLRMALFDRVVVLSSNQIARLVWSPEMSEEFRRDASELDEFVERWNEAATRNWREDAPGQSARIVAQTPRQAHRDAVIRAKEYIAAGDIYQVNLAQRFEIAPID